MPHQCGEQHGKGGHAVAERVRGSGQQSRGVQPLADGAVVYRHIQLHADGRRQNPDHQPAEIHQRGAQDLPNGLLGQLHAHQQDQHGDRQPGEIFRPAVAEGVVWIRHFGGDAEAQQRHHGGTGIGQVVECVRRDGNGTGESSGKELPGKEQQIQADPHRAAENTVGSPQLRGSPALWLTEKTR